MNSPDQGGFKANRWAILVVYSGSAVCKLIYGWQLTRVSRLLWEFWDHDSRATLLKAVGPIVRLDQTTILRQRVKFVRICLHIDITHPLPRSLTIAKNGMSMRVPLIYEGLHQVFPLVSHTNLTAVPNDLLRKKIQVVVQKFGDLGDCPPSKEPSSSTHEPPHLTDNWVTVSPKNRVRPLIGPRSKKTSTLKPQDTTVLTSGTSTQLVAALQLLLVPEQGVLAPLDPKGIILANPFAMKAQANNSTHSDNLVDIIEDEEEGMDADENVDMFLNLENIKDVEMPTDSTKRKRIEEGEECKSHT
ncbi:hypothetical protein Cgig2_001543 [Carnegiea gigantea]|uniref:Uncharacterized protein n=1 Tax=Carnegiea gigantea TaxID=171969 RepID=A0A9Q1GMA4_9CARY|nr:hypothetical protein Cgig2_001543 [Carnegiea gigantea]